MNYNKQKISKPKKSVDKTVVLRWGLVLVGSLLIARLFYVQIIKHDYYSAQAMAEHQKRFEIQATRGVVRLSDKNSSTPIVLNEARFLVYADPKYITDTTATANKIVGVIGGDVNEITTKLKNTKSRYVVLAKKITKDQADRVDTLALKGIYKKEGIFRTYPQGELASQLLGFVNDDGQGQYGIEEYLNEELAGKPGLEKAVTDIRGVPLAVNSDNILKQPQNGKDITLTVDIGMQRIAEEALKNGIDRTKSVRGTVVILEANSGAIKAMANYPTYDPSNFANIKDSSVFINNAVSGAWEPGSVMKPLLLTATFNEGTASPDTSYFDKGSVTIDDRTITNSINWGAQTMTFRDVINKSLNTGAVHALQTLGGGTINEKARTIWHDYLTNRYQFGKITGIEQAGESAGVVGSATEGDGLTVRYANMAFGQGLTITPLQLASAYSAMLNGGTYYKPSLIAKTGDNAANPTFESQIIRKEVVSEAASAQIRDMLQKSLEMNNKAAVRDGYRIGAKSGTAQTADNNGNYKSDVYNGAYVGYIGGDTPKYIMVVRLDEPKTSGFASSEAAKTWAEISNKIIDNFALQQKQ